MFNNKFLNDAFWGIIIAFLWFYLGRITNESWFSNQNQISNVYDKISEFIPRYKNCHNSVGTIAFKDTTVICVATFMHIDTTLRRIVKQDTVFYSYSKYYWKRDELATINLAKNETIVNYLNANKYIGLYSWFNY